MRLIPLLLLFSLPGIAAESGTVNQVAPPTPGCRAPGGFVLLGDPVVEILGKGDSNFTVDFDSTAYRENGFDESLKNVMDRWNSVPGSNLRFNFAAYRADSDRADGRLTILKGGGFRFPEGVLAVTVIRFNTNNFQIIDSDIFFNAGEPINNYTTKLEYDFEYIALHELGHALGLGHNEHCAASVMNATVDLGRQDRSLKLPEIEGARYLYSQGRPGGISAAPLRLIFTTVEAGPVPATRTIAVTGGSGTSWTATVSAADNGTWLTATPSSGAAGSNITVRANSQGLPSGVYTGTVSISGGGTILDVPVELFVTIPTLRITPDTLVFAAAPNGPTPELQIVDLIGNNGAPWTASATTTTGGNWLLLDRASGTLPSRLAIRVNHSGLAPATYRGTVRVTAAGATRDVAVQLEVSGQPRLLIEPLQVSLASQARANIPVCSSVRVGAFGNAPIDWRASASEPWLTVPPGSGRTPSLAAVCANAASLAAGVYNATATITAAAPNSPVNIAVRFTVSGAPRLSAEPVSSAGYTTQPIAPGQLVTLFGSYLAAGTAEALDFPLPVELAGTRVLVGGVPARLTYVSPGQINLIAPSSIETVAGSSTALTVYSGSMASPPARVRVSRYSPGIFTVFGGGAGAITRNRDGSLITRESPVEPGEIVSVYMTGLGPLDPSFPDGAGAPADPLARTKAPVRLRFDNQDGEVLYAGAVPGFAGLQVVVGRVPDLSRRIPEVQVEVDGTPSNVTTAGGPSVIEVAPAAVRADADASLELRGTNLPPSAAVRIGNLTLPGSWIDGDIQTLRVDIPAQVLGRSSHLTLTVVDPVNPNEPASNPVTVRVE